MITERLIDSKPANAAYVSPPIYPQSRDEDSVNANCTVFVEVSVQPSSAAPIGVHLLGSVSPGAVAGIKAVGEFSSRLTIDESDSFTQPSGGGTYTYSVQSSIWPTMWLELDNDGNAAVVSAWIVL